MAWSISDLFPPWGDSGERPNDNFEYEGGDQVNEKHLDYLWTQVGELEKETRSAFTDIDSDKDGVVDKANAGAAPFNLDGDIVDAASNTVYDDTNNYLLTDRIQADNGTAGEFLKTDGSTASWDAPSSVPSGTITIWSGTAGNIPNGWVLCDGNNGTPDLTGRFVIGAGGSYSQGDTGGTELHTLSVSELASHTHDFTTSEDDTHSSDTYIMGTSDSFNTSTFNTSSVGSDSAHENRPPYYALAYMQKT